MSPARPTAVVVAPETEATRALHAALRAQEIEVVARRDTAGGVEALAAERVDALIAELGAANIDALALLSRARERHPDTAVVLVAEGAGVGPVGEAWRAGATDVLLRPVDHERLVAILRRAFEHRRALARVAELERERDERFDIARLGGHSRAIARVMEQIRHLGATRATVLIEGEAGTGKGLVAQAIHQNSPRKREPFVRVDCAALGDGAIEGELFGDDSAGAPPRPGRFELAEGGTLFLDEVTEASPAAQLRLVRVLQDRELEPVGGHRTVRVDVRLIAAARCDLAAEVAAGRFREDLHARLSAVRIAMPALGERHEDIPVLVEAFLKEFNREHGRRVTGVTPGVLERLVRHRWVGNVRELRNTIEGMVALAHGRRALDVSDLPPGLRETGDDRDALGITVGMTVEEAERRLIAATLRRADFDKPRAAAMLGIGLRTLYRKIKAYGLR